MARNTVKKPVKKKLTWQQKIDKSERLNTLDEVKADADFNFRFRLQEKEAREAFEKLKNRGRLAEDLETLEASDQDDAGEGSEE